MIEFGTLTVKDESSIIEARNKVMVLAEDCGFDAIGSVRLATITSEICRTLQKGDSAKVTISLAEKENCYGLLLVFVSKDMSFPATKLRHFFDTLTTSQSPNGEQQIEVFRFITNAAFQLTEDFIHHARERLIKQSAEELFEELESKNKELFSLSGFLYNSNEALKIMKTEMIRILFVDDEPEVLKGLENSIFRQRSEWQMEFVTCGKEALEKLARAPFNGIVSDMQMSTMDGPTLLKHAMEKHPYECTQI